MWMQRLQSSGWFMPHCRSWWLHAALHCCIRPVLHDAADYCEVVIGGGVLVLGIRGAGLVNRRRVGSPSYCQFILECCWHSKTLLLHNGWFR